MSLVQPFEIPGWDVESSPKHTGSHTEAHIHTCTHTHMHTHTHTHSHGSINRHFMYSTCYISLQESSLFLKTQPHIHHMNPSVGPGTAYKRVTSTLRAMLHVKASMLRDLSGSTTLSHHVMTIRESPLSFPSTQRGYK